MDKRVLEVKMDRQRSGGLHLMDIHGLGVFVCCWCRKYFSRQELDVYVNPDKGCVYVAGVGVNDIVFSGFKEIIDGLNVAAVKYIGVAGTESRKVNKGFFTVSCQNDKQQYREAIKIPS